jgi:glutamate dehydrogenase (NAD(P)+)
VKVAPGGAIGGAIDSANADSVRARMIVEGANNPTTPGADEILNATACS